MTDTSHLDGVDDGGGCIEVWEHLSDQRREEDTEVEARPSHGTAEVQTEGGERETVMMCEMEPEDINDDGTVSTPLSGTCTCLEDP